MRRDCIEFARAISRFCLMNRRFTSKSSQVSGTSLETHKHRGSDKDIQDSTDSAAAGRSFNLAIVVGCEESIVESKLVKEE